MVVLCHCLWAGWGPYPDPLQVIQDPRVVWLYTWLGSSQEEMEVLWISGFNRPFGVPSHSCFWQKNYYYIQCVPNGPKYNYKISLDHNLRIKRSVLVTFSDRMMPTITVFVRYKKKSANMSCLPPLGRAYESDTMQHQCSIPGKPQGRTAWQTLTLLVSKNGSPSHLLSIAPKQRRNHPTGVHSTQKQTMMFRILAANSSKLFPHVTQTSIVRIQLTLGTICTP